MLFLMERFLKLNQVETLLAKSTIWNGFKSVILLASAALKGEIEAYLSYIPELKKKC